MRNHPTSISEQAREQEFFDSVTEDEIMYHWRAIKSKGLSDDDAWQAIVTGIALDMAFAKSKTFRQIEH
ncbi:MAG: hypothetical protein HYU31_16450 [Deltaproteobacteria bacterium]|nr:hypothetical protein [Deltaproteobacteria bacterium]MBI2182395.1 hypothetical protein [Deltaproteobacteria bacterium]MBI2229861.1 hypothetical protein [Deltaproteobacteria bacterium]MBI2367510.1 hypothetical protein [Deltaproteobacteria bacterium]MBI2534503.1 hypothetical protein [Deltaproteobacteria bacterium]